MGRGGHTRARPRGRSSGEIAANDYREKSPLLPPLAPAERNLSVRFPQTGTGTERERDYGIRSARGEEGIRERPTEETADADMGVRERRGQVMMISIFSNVIANCKLQNANCKLEGTGGSGECARGPSGFILQFAICILQIAILMTAQPARAQKDAPRALEPDPEIQRKAIKGADRFEVLP